MKKIYFSLGFLIVYFQVGAQWSPTSGPPSVNGGSNIYSLLVNGNDIYAGTQEEIYLTHDSGSTWILDTAGFNIPPNSFYSMGELCNMGNTLITLKGPQEIYRCDMSSNYWTLAGQINNFFQFGSFAAIGNSLFAGGYGGTGIQVSQDTGISWSPVVSTGLSNNWILSLSANGTSLYAATILGVFVSSNLGLSWSSVGLDTLITRLIITRGDTLYSVAQGKGLCYSVNNGITWDIIYPELSYYSQVNVVLINGDKLFIGTNGDGVFVSDDHGVSWTDVGNGLPDSIAVSSLEIVGNNIFAGTQTKGVYKAALGELIGINENQLITIRASVFPNPFTLTTTISFSIEQKHAIITVTDLPGKAITTNKFSGKELTLDRAALRNGIYFLQITDDLNNTFTKKILVQ